MIAYFYSHGQYRCFDVSIDGIGRPWHLTPFFKRRVPLLEESFRTYFKLIVHFRTKYQISHHELSLGVVNSISEGEPTSNVQNGRKKDDRREKLCIINISQTIYIFNKHKEQNLLSIKKYIHMSNFISKHKKWQSYTPSTKCINMKICVFARFHRIDYLNFTWPSPAGAVDRHSSLHGRFFRRLI